MPQPRRAEAALVILAGLAAALAGCGGDHSTPSATTQPRPHTRTTTVGRPATAPELVPLRCPAGAANCASATGRVVYVEKVDPDGDGDAHFVLFGGNVTGRGLSVIDVERVLRPDPLPRIGDRVAAVGPVYAGSHGQKQIQATAVRVSRR